MTLNRVTLLGTDTGVGKTWIGCRLVAELRARGATVGVFKPIESGCGPDEGPLVPADAFALIEAAGGAQSADSACPWPLPRPLTPASELQRLGRQITASQLVRAADAAQAGADWLVVETAGGVLSPLTSSLASADLASLLGGVAVLVAPNRLGAISQAVAALEAARSREVVVAAVLLNNVGDVDAEVARSNEAWIRHACPETRLFVVSDDVSQVVDVLLPSRR